MTIEEYLQSPDPSMIRIGYQLLQQSQMHQEDKKDIMEKNGFVRVSVANSNEWYASYYRRVKIDIPLSEQLVFILKSSDT